VDRKLKLGRSELVPVVWFVSRQTVDGPAVRDRRPQCTGTFTVAQVDDEEKSPFRFGNPRFGQAELIAQHFAGPHKAQPQYSNIYLRRWIL
jgi:hypothetical protein